MQIDLRTVSIKPLRHTFDNIAKRFGDKPASRYQEGTYDVQQTDNFHYRPTWEPEYTLFDKSRTTIVMKDWYALKDPRQYYYGSYTIARARQQDVAEANFDMVEERNLVALVPNKTKQKALNVLLPLRHVEWGGNMNNAFMCAYGYGTSITQPCLFQSMDHLGIAQYLTRLGLILGDTDALDQAKAAWLKDPAWQGWRKFLEDSFVIKDWFELFVAQNLVMEGMMFPLFFDQLDNMLSAEGGSTISMMTRFMTEWYEETAKWVDAQIKVAAAESAENKEKISKWAVTYRDLILPAIKPVAQMAFEGSTDDILAEQLDAFNRRCQKLGLTV